MRQQEARGILQNERSEQFDSETVLTIRRRALLGSAPCNLRL